MIWLAVSFGLVALLAFIFGVLCGHAMGWHSGYEAANAPGETVPAGATPLVRDDAAATRRIEEWTGHQPMP